MRVSSCTEEFQETMSVGLEKQARRVLLKSKQSWVGYVCVRKKKGGALD